MKNISFTKILVASLTLIICALGEMSAQADLAKVTEQADILTPPMVDLYKNLHQFPELSLQEKNTSTLLAKAMREAGYDVSEKVGGYGVVGVLRNGDGPVVLIRTDMDGLPVEEKTGLPYESKVRAKDKNGKEVGVMHACGHDIHMSVFIGVARALVNLKKYWKGTLILMGQPAEEIGAGAKAMLEDGLFTKFPTPDYAIALHDNAFLPAGKVGYKEGPFMASVDRIDLTVFGVGGHGASPHSTKDPIVLSAEIIMAFQTIVSRETNPVAPSVVTVGSIHGGTTHNIIPEQVKLQLTIRSYSDGVRSKTLESLQRISTNMALAAGLPKDKLPVLEIDSLWTPATINDPELTGRFVRSASKILGENNVVEMEPNMVGEDFSFLGRQDKKVKTCMFWLGAIAEEQYGKYKNGEISLPSLHSATFAPLPTPTINTGIKTMTATVIDLFTNKK